MTHEELVVRTTPGTVSGAREANGVRVWRGVPYAAPLSGPARFRAPQPAAAWEGTRDATSFGSICPQPPLAGVAPKEPMGDDCLVANVWSPAGAEGLPVLVWLHGGAYTLGSSSAPVLNGAELARRGPLVVVTLNYRLGYRGFLDLSMLKGAQGKFETNLGLRDQIAALRWVQENIHAFGGDPGRVTLGGQSAGGGSVCCLLASPLARGLFSRAIAQSPPASSVFDRERARVVTRKFLEALGRPEAGLAELEAIDEKVLLETSGTLLTELTRVFPGHHAFQPVIDSEVLLDTPLRSMAARHGSTVPLLIGSNEDEGSLFVRAPMPPLIPTSDQAVRQFLAQEHPGAVDKVPRAYASHGRFGPNVAMGGDGMVTMPAAMVAERVSRRAPAYLYRFRWTNDDLMAKRVGSPHTIDLPFVFGALGEFRLSELKGNAPEISAAMQEAWLGFIRGDAPKLPGGTEWKPYDVGTRATLVIDQELRMEQDLDGAQRAAWGAW